MNKDITITLDKPGLFLQATYDCNIVRHREFDGSGRTWWEPELESTLIRVDMTNDDDEEIEWFYGDPKPRAIVRALEMYEDTLEELLSERVWQMISEASFENNPHEGEPRDD